MKNIVILIPVYNDWESLKKLLEEINKIFKVSAILILIV